MPIDDFHYLTRIHYKSENSPKDGRWGEHEIDYCLIIQKDVNVDANWNEVKHYEYVDKETLKNKMGTALIIIEIIVTNYREDGATKRGGGGKYRLTPSKRGRGREKF